MPSSSSEVPSSSSVESSSSEESSSSVEESSSSDNTQVAVTGSLEQTVVQGEPIETITFNNVQKYNRDTWTMWFVDFTHTGDVVTVAGTIPVYVPAGSYKETLTVNGQKYEFALEVAVPESSSSAASSSSEKPKSSSSEKPVSSSSETPTTSSSVFEPESSSSVSPGTSSSEGTIFVISPVANPLSLVVAGRTLHISGASDIAVEIFDMKGTPIATFGHVSGAVSLDMLRQGSFVVRLRSGSNMLIRRIVVK